jgi:hypothetical protein
MAQALAASIWAERHGRACAAHDDVRARTSPPFISPFLLRNLAEIILLTILPFRLARQRGPPKAY